LLNSFSSGNCVCQTKTATLATISRTVRIGNRLVGRLSLSGIRGAEA
jgi:hypothetical protein